MRVVILSSADNTKSCFVLIQAYIHGALGTSCKATILRALLTSANYIDELRAQLPIQPNRCALCNIYAALRQVHKAEF